MWDVYNYLLIICNVYVIITPCFYLKTIGCSGEYYVDVFMWLCTQWNNSGQMCTLVESFKWLHYPVLMADLSLPRTWKVYLPFCKVADTPFHVQVDVICILYNFNFYIMTVYALLVYLCKYYSCRSIGLKGWWVTLYQEILTTFSTSRSPLSYFVVIIVRDNSIII